MSDNERIVLGRTDKFGNGTTIVIWDLMGNQALRRLKYDAAIGFADYISYLNLSTDNRYVVAGFQNSYDGKANYIIFDLTLDNNQEPKVLALDAQIDVTAVLSTHEIVTGTRSGELTIWSMRTGKLLRQLVTPPAGAQSLARGGLAPATAAHRREVTSLSVSKDAKLLVSASADGTLKVWDMDTEKLMYTLTGHSDEVRKFSLLLCVRTGCAWIILCFRFGVALSPLMMSSLLLVQETEPFACGDSKTGPRSVSSTVAWTSSPSRSATTRRPSLPSEIGKNPENSSCYRLCAQRQGVEHQVVQLLL